LNLVRENLPPPTVLQDCLPAQQKKTRTAEAMRAVQHIW
jgi:hypothetical protein